MPDGVNNQFGSLVDSKRVHDVRAMDGNCVRAEMQFGGNLLVRFAARNQLQDLKFACRQAMFPFTFERRLALKSRIQHLLAGRDAADSVREVQVGGALQDIASSPSSQ